MTFGCVLAVVLNEKARMVVTGLPSGLIILAIILSVIIEMSLMCCLDVARRVPSNYILLFGFTLLETFICTWFSAHYSPHLVLLSIGLTGVVTSCISGYACTTKTDFTELCAPVILIMMAVMLFTTLAMLFMPFSVFWHPIVAAIGVIFAGICLLFDTQ